MRYRSKSSDMTVEAMRINHSMTINYDKPAGWPNGNAGDYLVSYPTGHQQFVAAEVMNRHYEPEQPGATIAIHLEGLEKLERAHTLALGTLAAIKLIDKALA